jgi:hypothetical protein
MRKYNHACEQLRRYKYKTKSPKAVEPSGFSLTNIL